MNRLTATTMTYVEEAAGAVKAAAQAGLPVVVSFTVETDGRLPDGSAPSQAIARTDAATDGYADFFMVNCAHPTHIAAGIDGSEALDRIGRFRVNASRLSHADLDGATALDDGDPADLARETVVLGDRLSGIQLLGGCCGTDARHVEQLLTSWVASNRARSQRTL